jgi:hypothetical protein
MNARKFYMLIGTLAGSFALILQLYLIIKNVPQSGKSYLSESIRYISFMTIWTNILVTLSFALPLVAKNSGLNKFLSRPILQTGTLLYITIVLIVYHFLLAQTWSPKGWQKIADVTLHYVVPTLYIVYWFLFIQKGNQQWNSAYKWLIYPLVYVVYAMLRGAIVNEYPYPFIDVTTHGYGVVLKNIAMLSAAYYVAGLLVVTLDKALARQKS